MRGSLTMKDEKDYIPPTREDILSDLDKPLRNKLFFIKVFEFEIPLTLEECVQRLQGVIPMRHGLFKGYLAVDLFPLRSRGYAFGGWPCNVKRENYAPTVEMSGMLVPIGGRKVAVAGRASSALGVMLAYMVIFTVTVFVIINRQALASGNIVIRFVLIFFLILGTGSLLMSLINRNRMITALKTRLTSP